jgi:hypothetical protein
MSAHQDVWHTEPDGILATEVGGYRLIVQAAEHDGGSVCFLVLRGGGAEDTLALVASGTEANVRTAMKAAAQMAARLP